MAQHRPCRLPVRIAGAALALALCAQPAAAPLSRDEVATLCAQAEGANHCGRKIEEAQLARLPNLAVRDGATLKILRQPIGYTSFTDTEALNGGRSYSLWDYLEPIDAVLLYTTDGDTVSFTLFLRGSASAQELPTEPKLSPDRQRLVTADFCESRCVNEVALWRLAADGLRKESTWKPRERWTDAAAGWKDASTLVIEFVGAGAQKAAVLERRLSDPGWIRATAP